MKNVAELRIIFMGTSSLAMEVLNSLIREKYDVIAVYTQPDKKVGRREEITGSPVKNLAEQKKLSLFQPNSFDENEILNIKKLRPDLIIVVAYGKILSGEVLGIPSFGSLNVHASLLPKYRGASPIQSAILSGENKTGVTIMLMDEGIDTGDIISQKEIDVDPEDTTEIITEKVSKLGTELLIETVPLWVGGKIKSRRQDHSQATFCKIIKKEDGLINWEDEAGVIYNKYRAFYLWPGVFSFWEKNGKSTRIKFHKLSYDKNDPESKRNAGEVFKHDNEVCIQSSRGIIILKEIQIEGKSIASADEFINGYPEF
ncbi:MAG TPA: methionyl-tRNA formyltransferase, partial [Candidatus Moranbacteria bacterium]|nr:methionyl-tRNA formyltransferase [Candidatus Moranbacteria bacterium]